MISAIWGKPDNGKIRRMAALLESIFCEILKNPRANRHYRTHPTNSFCEILKNPRANRHYRTHPTNSSAPAEKITQIFCHFSRISTITCQIPRENRAGKAQEGLSGVSRTTLALGTGRSHKGHECSPLECGGRLAWA